MLLLRRKPSSFTPLPPPPRCKTRLVLLPLGCFHAPGKQPHLYLPPRRNTRKFTSLATWMPSSARAKRDQHLRFQLPASASLHRWAAAILCSRIHAAQAREAGRLQAQSTCEPVGGGLF